jgi:hypothetical protein
MSSFIKTLLQILIAILQVFAFSCVVLIIFVIWGGGYWENIPIFDRLSGPKRFAQYVADPIPTYITEIRGGYSGFPQGQITTDFKFSIEPEKWEFLTDWTDQDIRKNPKIVALAGPEILVSRIYQHKDERYERYLIIDEQSKHGFLWVP